MDENIKNKLSSVLSGINKGKMSEVSELLSSEDGKRLISALSESEKKALIQKFMSMDTNEIGKRLKNFNKESIKNLTTDEIKNKFR